MNEVYEINEVVYELDGNGYSKEDIFNITNMLVQYVSIRREIIEKLEGKFEDYKIEDIIDNLIHSHEQQHEMGLFLSTLTEKQYEAYIMKTVRGMTNIEIGKELGINRNVVAQRLRLVEKKMMDLGLETVAPMNDLTARQKACYLMKERDGLTYNQIADILGITKGTVESHVIWARKKLYHQNKD